MKQYKVVLNSSRNSNSGYLLEEGPESGVKVRLLSGSGRGFELFMCRSALKAAAVVGLGSAVLGGTAPAQAQSMEVLPSSSLPSVSLQEECLPVARSVKAAEVVMGRRVSYSTVNNALLIAGSYHSNTTPHSNTAGRDHKNVAKTVTPPTNSLSPSHANTTAIPHSNSSWTNSSGSGGGHGDGVWTNHSNGPGNSGHVNMVHGDFLF